MMVVRVLKCKSRAWYLPYYVATVGLSQVTVKCRVHPMRLLVLYSELDSMSTGINFPTYISRQNNLSISIPKISAGFKSRP